MAWSVSAIRKSLIDMLKHEGYEKYGIWILLCTQRCRKPSKKSRIVRRRQHKFIVFFDASPCSSRSLRLSQLSIRYPFWRKVWRLCWLFQLSLERVSWGEKIHTLKENCRWRSTGPVVFLPSIALNLLLLLWLLWRWQPEPEIVRPDRWTFNHRKPIPIPIPSEAQITALSRIRLASSQ